MGITEEAKGKEHRQKRLRRRWGALAVLGLLIAFVAIRITRFVTAQPTITTDYASEYNALTRPAPYDPNDNAAPLYEEAFAILSAVPGDSEALERVAQATERPYCWIEWTCLNGPRAEAQTEIGAYMAGFRQAALGFRDQARWLARDGEMGRALQTVTAIGKMARHAGGPGSMLGQGLVGAALNGLAQSAAFAVLAEHPVSADLLAAFQQDVETILVNQEPVSFAGERVRLRDMVQRYFTDDGKGDGHLIVGKVFDEYRRREELPNELADAAAYLNHLAIAWRHPSRKETVQLLEDLISLLDELARQTPWQLHQRSTSFEDEIRRRIADYYFLELTQLDRSLGRPLEIRTRVRLSAEALVATIALLRHRQDKGRLPESLQELVEDGYMSRVPADPYSGGPLAYEPTGETFVLYSFGADFDDDGGTPSVWGRGAKGGDQVFWPQ
jgi:hypothetical protein